MKVYYYLTYHLDFHDDILFCRYKTYTTSFLYFFWVVLFCRSFYAFHYKLDPESHLSFGFLKSDYSSFCSRFHYCVRFFKHFYFNGYAKDKLF